MSSVGLESFGLHVAVGIFPRWKEMRFGLLMELQCGGVRGQRALSVKGGFCCFQKQSNKDLFLIIICCNSCHTHTPDGRSCFVPLLALVKETGRPSWLASQLVQVVTVCVQKHRGMKVRSKPQLVRGSGGAPPVLPPFCSDAGE